MASSLTDFEIRKALSLSAIHKMKTIWSIKMENSLKKEPSKLQSNPYYYMLANAGQSTPQCVSKYMVVIPSYLEWPQIYQGKIRSPIHNCTGEFQRSLR